LYRVTGFVPKGPATPFALAEGATLSGETAVRGLPPFVLLAVIW